MDGRPKMNRKKLINGPMNEFINAGWRSLLSLDRLHYPPTPNSLLVIILDKDPKTTLSYTRPGMVLSRSRKRNREKQIQVNINPRQRLRCLIRCPPRNTPRSFKSVQ